MSEHMMKQSFQGFPPMDQEYEASSSPTSSSPPPSHLNKPKPRPKIKGIDEAVMNQIADEEEEDIWPEEVERYFQEALRIYPPIGRRKLLENGKMYGRNELIAKYIFQKTGKIRTRKQVSSHIQVLGKKQKKLVEGSHKGPISSFAHHPIHSFPSSLHQNVAPVFPSNYGVTPSYQNLQTAQSLQGAYPSTSVPQGPSNYYANQSSYLQQDDVFKGGFPSSSSSSSSSSASSSASSSHSSADSRVDFGAFSASAAAAGFRGLPVQLRHFYAYMENASNPLSGMVNRHYYVSLNGNDFDYVDDVSILQIENRFFGLRELYEKSAIPCFFFAKCYVNANPQQNFGLHALYVKYESKQRMTLKCSTTVYSFGKAVVEKIQVEDPVFEYNSYAYYFNHSPMCDYMVQFIEKLKSLNDTSKMNRVLENFSVLQVILDTQTNTTLMATALVYEVAEGGVIRNRVSKITSPLVK